MLERGMHQGASLLHTAPGTELRFAAVAGVPDALGLETLWHLCAHLQHLGYPTVVLDGCTPENEAAPGLEQLLEQDPWAETPGPDWHSGAASIAVLPSARGLHRLAHEAQAYGRPAPLAPLQPHFRAYALAVLHAPVQWLGPLLQASAATPLIFTPPGTAGTQQAYRQIKHLALHAGLPSQVCAVVRGRESTRARRARAQIATLQRCAADHLGIAQRGLVVDAENPQDLQRLALQLLENGGTIAGAGAPPLSMGHAGHAPFLSH
jgi:hypothetical protein